MRQESCYEIFFTSHTTSPPRCTPNQCHDETGTCFSASGFCFTSLHKDTNGEFVVLKQGCLNQNKIGLAYMKSTLCPNDPLFVVSLVMSYSRNDVTITQ